MAGRARGRHARIPLSGVLTHLDITGSLVRTLQGLIHMNNLSPGPRLAGLVCLAAAVCIAGVDLSSQGRRGRRATTIVEGREVAEGEVIVRYRDPEFAVGRARAEFDADADEVETVGRRGLRRMHSRRHRTRELLALLRANPDVEFVEPNYVITADATPNDPAFGNLWGLFNSGQSIQGTAGIPGVDIGATQAWNSGGGNRSHVVGIIDTGIDYNHPDLAANIWSAPQAFSVTIGSLTINCAAGTHGFNAINNTCDPMDDNNHGTHVAGTIGAVGNNGVGIAGVNWFTRMMGLKFLSAGGSGFTSDAIKAIEFAVQANQVVGANVRILSNSWGGGGYSAALLDAINRANTSNMLFVASAGNDNTNTDVAPAYPASYNSANIISVAATDNRDNRAWFSNYGPSSVDIGAPGVAIYSTVRNNGYAYFNGTSMAAPHVSGAAALLLSQCSSLSTAQLRSAILGTVDPVASMTGVTVTGGRLNANRALQSCMGQVQLLGVSPNSGAGMSQTFTLTYGDTAGAMDLTVAGAWFGSSTNSSSNSCVSYYNPNTSRVYLLNDAGSAWTPAALGSGVLANSSCSINLGGSSATTSGNTLTVNLALTFTSSMLGTKNIYMYGAGQNGAAAVGWSSRGTWTVADSRIVPTITWNTPAPIVYPTPISSTQLNATANVPGTFAYTVTPTTVLNAGANQIVALFTPTNTTLYQTASKTITLTVNKAMPSVTWANPANISSGTPLSATQLNATASVAGTFSYNPPAGSVLAAGSQTLSTTFTPAMATNYSSVTRTAALTVLGPAVVTADSVSPAAQSGNSQVFTLQYSDSVGYQDLNFAGAWFGASTAASAGSCVTYFNPGTAAIHLLNDAGTAWTSAAIGSVGPLQNSACRILLNGASTASGAGSALTLDLSMQFAPAYVGAKTIYMMAANPSRSTGWVSRGSYTVNDGRVAPTVTWATPAAITFPALLTSTQLNATASVPGTFTYSPAAGTRPNAGAQVLSVTFTPTDNATYLPVTRTVSLGVARATPLVSWATPGAIQIGTALGAGQLNATANVPGAFNYTPGPGTVLPAGLGQVLMAMFMPADAVNYSSVPVQTTINVTGPASLAIGSLSPNSGAGNTQIFSAQFTDSNGAGDLNLAALWFAADQSTINSCAAYYNPSNGRLHLLNDAGSSWLSAAIGSGILQNTQCRLDLAATTATINGNTLQLDLAVIFNPSYAGTKTISMLAANPAGRSTGWTPRGSWSVTDGRAVPAVTWAQPSAIVYGTALGATQMSATSPVAGAFTYSPAAGTVLGAGTHTLTAVFTPSDVTAFLPRTVTTTISVTPSGSPLSWSQPPNITTGTALGAGQLNATSVVGGAFVYSPPAGAVLAIGTHTLSATFYPSTPNYAIGTITTQVVVTPVPGIFVDSISPSAGRGAIQPFVVQYTDSVGATDLSVAAVWFRGDAGTTSNACVIYYNPQTSQIFLLNDAGTAWLPGSFGAGTLQNSSCSLALGTSSAAASGPTLTLNLALTFTPAFAGTKSVMMYAGNPSGRGDGWSQRGTWVVP